MQNNFDLAVMRMFAEELNQKPGSSLQKEASKHLMDSDTLKHHLMNACKQIEDYPIPDGKQAFICSMLNGFFEFGYRVRRIESQIEAQQAAPVI